MAKKNVKLNNTKAAETKTTSVEPKIVTINKTVGLYLGNYDTVGDLIADMLQYPLSTELVEDEDDWGHYNLKVEETRLETHAEARKRIAREEKAAKAIAAFKAKLQGVKI